jgi:16S rRNA (cytidine1402-2'-O)-methyltransferase
MQTILKTAEQLRNVTNQEGSPRPALFLIPNLLGDAPVESSLPASIANTISGLRHFLVEEEKSARGFIKALCPELQIRELSIRRIPEDPTPAQVRELMSPLHIKKDEIARPGLGIGVISEAGCPGIADPGAVLVSYAHSVGIPVVPLVGPCSMVLALMASGLNGQSWRFVGYLPIDGEKRTRQIAMLNERVKKYGETQIIMDTPYRNDRLLEDLLGQSLPETRLCIAQGLTTRDEFIRTKSISDWRRNLPQLHRRSPCLFLIGAAPDLDQLEQLK